MKLAIVIQRYGDEVAGGAEWHCRQLAERLARSHDVEILATCALDYVRWDNHYPEGVTQVGGLRVERFRVDKPRTGRFASISSYVFNEEHGAADEIEWVRENGPRSERLLRAVRSRSDIDLFLFYCYRYYHSYFGLPDVADRAVLVPTAEEDEVVHLGVFAELLRKPRGIVYLTPEERELIQRVSGNARVPSVIVGGGVDEGGGVALDPGDVRRRLELPERFLLYVGRVDRNKGVERLLRYYGWLYEQEGDALPPLILAGRDALGVGDRPNVRQLGFVTAEEKWALLRACEVFVLPSPYESLCLALLEAWSAARPVLVNGRCKVLEGQTRRADGGLWFDDYAEFAAAMRELLGRPDLRRRLGENGRRFVAAEHGWDRAAQATGAFLRGLVPASR